MLDFFGFWLVLANRGFVGGFGFSRVGFVFVWIRLQVRKRQLF